MFFSFATTFGQIKPEMRYEDKRICFYAIGFAEGLLLDKLNPKWHDNYLIDKFNIERYSEK
jgi:hypothetical protein